MKDAKNVTLGLAVLCGALCAARADAQPSPAARGAASGHGAHEPGPAKAAAAKRDPRGAPEHVPGKPSAVPAASKSNPAGAKADKTEVRAAAKAEKAGTKAREAEARGDDAPAKADRAGEKGGDDGANAASPRGRARGAAHGRHTSALRAMHEELKQGKVNKEALKARLAELKDSRGERRKAHREALKERWGAGLAHAATREELRHHARRIAFLERALIVAQTDSKAKEQPKLVERIEKLIEKENARHERAMERLKSSPPATQPAALEVTEKQTDKPKEAE